MAPARPDTIKRNLQSQADCLCQRWSEMGKWGNNEMVKWQNKINFIMQNDKVTKW